MALNAPPISRSKSRKAESAGGFKKGKVGRGDPEPSPKANTPVEISAPTPRTTARGRKYRSMKQEPRKRFHETPSEQRL